MNNKSTSFNEIRNIKVDNKLFDFSTPKIMGILNLTPDSFYDGDRYNDVWLKRTEELLISGADIIDVGAASTRPGAKYLSVDDELKRITEPLKVLTRSFPDAVFSVDTFRAKVAEETISIGAHIINDISGGTMDTNMFETIARLNVPYILMHIHGTPQTMMDLPIEANIVHVVKNFFQKAVNELTELGVDNIILDPGFGFGKTTECNYVLLKNLEKIRIDKLPILAGISRKSMITKVLNNVPKDALNGTTVLNSLALFSGANILRVHDVEEAKQVVKIVEFMKEIEC